MQSLNRCSFIGNLGRDPEIRNTNSGERIASFALACSESWTDKSTGERKERTEWVPVSVFNDGLVGVIEKYVKKGSRVYVDGKFKTRKWQDSNGQDRYTTEIVLDKFSGTLLMLDSAGGRAEPQERKTVQMPVVEDGQDDGLVPF